MNRDLEKMVKEALVTVREDIETVLNVYDLIEADDEVSEQLFTMTFKPQMVEIVKNLEEIETLTAQMTARCQETREQATRDHETRDQEARTRDRDRNWDQDPVGEPKWHIQKQFKPAK